MKYRKRKKEREREGHRGQLLCPQPWRKKESERERERERAAGGGGGGVCSGGRQRHSQGNTMYTQPRKGPYRQTFARLGGRPSGQGSPRGPIPQASKQARASSSIPEGSCQPRASQMMGEAITPSPVELVPYFLHNWTSSTPFSMGNLPTFVPSCLCYLGVQGDPL